jgi:hypothetical protein
MLSVMTFVQEENENLTDQHLEIWWLHQLGIDVNDPTLRQRELDIAVLDISNRLAHHHWKVFYNHK